MDNDRKIQMVELNILHEFVKICNENNLKYFLVAGTLLGAIRHEGFIPWDDDIDVAMPRNDFELFFEKYYKYLPANMYTEYYLRYDNNDKSFPRNPRIVDKDHIIKVRVYTDNDRINPFIDVFVLDGMPENKVIRMIHFYHLIFLRILYKFSANGTAGIYLKRSMIEKIGIFIASRLKLGRFLNTKKIFLRLNNIMKKYPYDESKYTIMFMADYKDIRVLPRKLYGKGRVVTFEGIDLIIPSYAEKILESMYGNYMQLPPESERHPRHGGELLY